MLDPVSQVAFAVSEAKGVYALLLGSGISRAAEIPTGWAITLELVTKVAKLRGEEAGADPEAWYQATFGGSPDYSKLLDQVARTPAERQRLLSRYFERSATDAAHAKRPTEAHRAIAQLVAAGYVRVIVTPNFDRLLESALSELGVEPTVVTSSDQAEAAVPLVHERGCLVIKVHGDYRDTRLKNTPDELANYDKPMNALLRQVFDDFGLIVCGWSADFDTALRAAVAGGSGRYSLFWAAFNGCVSSTAQKVVDARRGLVVPIGSADGFFSTLGSKVRQMEPGAFDSLGGIAPARDSAADISGAPASTPAVLSAAPAPDCGSVEESIESAVSRLKEYLPDPRYQIRLQDLIERETCKCIDDLDDHQLDVTVWGNDKFADHAEKYEKSVERLMRLAWVAGRWSDSVQAVMWSDVVAQLAKRGRHVSGATPLIDLMVYPAALVMFAYCLGAVMGGRPAEFGAVATQSIDFGYLGSYAASDRLNSACLISNGGQDRFKSLAAYGNRQLAGSDRIFDVLRAVTGKDIRDDESFEQMFAEVEIAFSLGFAERLSGNREPRYWWAPPGRFVFRAQMRQAIFRRWKADYKLKGQGAIVSLMAGLTKPPMLDELEALSARFW